MATDRDVSIVEYMADNEGYSCGYCRSSNSNFSHGMWAHVMTVQDYQSLIDRGWRRSGKYCYKPTMNLVCCPQYAIRCEVLKFKLSKSQKNVLKKMNRYLGGEWNQPEKWANTSIVGIGTDMAECNVDSSVQSRANSVRNNLLYQENIKSDFDENETDENVIQSEEKATVCALPQKSSSTEKKDHAPQRGLGADPNKPPCKKAKLLRLERKLQKTGDHNTQQAVCTKEKTNAPKELEEFLFLDSKNLVHKLEVRLVQSNPKSKELIRTMEQSHAVYSRYQQVIHNDSPSKCTMSQYQRFLVDSPLQPSRLSGGTFCGYGSFHQQYWLDDKLIAVGVLDVLPNCVSSVYFYYDPNYRFLTLGTYASLREVAFTRQLQKTCPSLKYYYMGFYIHSCPKMRYKGQYSPSFLLCPEVYSWHPIENSKIKLDQSRYNRLEDNPDKEDGNRIDVHYVSVLYNRTAMPYHIYKMKKKQYVTTKEESEVIQYSKLVGGECAQRMLLFRA